MTRRFEDSGFFACNRRITDQVPMPRAGGCSQSDRGKFAGLVKVLTLAQREREERPFNNLSNLFAFTRFGPVTPGVRDVSGLYS